MIEATVIIAAWCAESTLEQCVDSALGQAGVALEVIVVDDASPDNTRARADALAVANPQVRVLSLPRNGGPAAARNAALASARGEWIAVLDSDDTLRPDRLRRLIDFAKATGADIACDRLVLVDAAGQEAAAAPLDFRGDPTDRPWSVADYIHGNQAHDGKLSLGFLKPVFRRAFLQDQGIRYDESLRNGEDFHLVLAALTQGASLRYLPEDGYLYTMRAGSVSNRLDPAHADALDRADAAFLARHGQRLGPEERKLMRRRMLRNADFAATEVAMHALKTRRPLAALRTLAERPRATRRFLTQLLEAARKRSSPARRPRRQ